jgi:hypothetical protein
MMTQPQATHCTSALEADFMATVNFVPVSINLFSGKMPHDEMGELQKIKVRERSSCSYHSLQCFSFNFLIGGVI